jgi:hypothetical protein
MKKNEVKKLRLSRETLHALTSPDAQRVVGASLGISCPSNGGTVCVGGGGGAACPMDAATPSETAC